MTSVYSRCPVIISKINLLCNFDPVSCKNRSSIHGMSSWLNYIMGCSILYCILHILADVVDHPGIPCVQKMHCMELY